MTVFSIIMGVLMVIGGISMLATPLQTFLSLGYYIIILFFVSGLLGIIRGFSAKRFGLDFFFAILSLILGILGFIYPDAVAMNNNYVLLYFAAFWFFVRGILSIATAVQLKAMTGTGAMVLGIILGIVEILLGIYSVAHPNVLAVTLGFLIAFFFIESGINMIVIGSEMAKFRNSLSRFI